MPTRDKIRPLIMRWCADPECEFHSTQEWAWLRHEAETGHQMKSMETRLSDPRAQVYAARAARDW